MAGKDSPEISPFRFDEQKIRCGFLDDVTKRKPCVRLNGAQIDNRSYLFQRLAEMIEGRAVFLGAKRSIPCMCKRIVGSEN